ncbi:MAG: hypothetical protein LBD99_02845 [Candidatus Margulisbacteria bacterium]|jgi:outer membrane protein assembly factor BamB|nr:hypothetical protein [Candidatus Margulisiibacteriota bacterium]
MGILFLAAAAAHSAAEPSSSPAATANLQLVKTLDLSRTTKQPNAIVTDGRFIYVTDRTGGLYKYDAEGTLITELSRLNNDFFIAGDLAQDNEYLYLTDELSKSVIKVNKQLDLSAAHKIELKNVELFNPSGLYIDKNQDIYLSDSAGDQVYCFNALGLLEWRRGLFGGAAQSLNTPGAIAVFENSPVVLDRGNRAVKKISPDRLEILARHADLLSLAAHKQNLFVGAGDGIYIYPAAARLELAPGLYPADLFIFNNLLYVLDSRQRKIWIYAIY